jgi:hypothetical protein
MKYRYILSAILLISCCSAFSYQIVEPNQNLRTAYAEVVGLAISKLPPSISDSVTKNLIFELDSNSRHSGSSLLNRIRVNRNLIEMYREDPNKKNFISFTRHRNLKMYITATILHELAHVIDFSDERWDGLVQLNCSNYSSLESNYDPFCHDFVSRRGRISRDPNFLNLSFFFYSGMGSSAHRSRSNFFEKRSIDPYEFSDEKEAFAVNFEFFILDPDFKCKKPGLYKFYEQLFSHTPFNSKQCTGYGPQFYLSPNINLDSSLSVDVVRPKGKLFEAHYLLAGKGKSTMSSYGHAMIRLVYCAPEKTVADESCLYDVDEHVVINPAANIAGLDMSGYDGLVGNYYSQATASRLGDVVYEYSSIEEREIFSIPMGLSESQLNSLEQTILEVHWTYKNKYYFMTNNCAVEVLNYLKRAISGHTSLLNIFSVDPMDLFVQLKKSNILIAKELEEIRQDKSKRYYFPSMKKFYDKKEQDLASDLKMKMKSNYRDMPSQERALLLEKIGTDMAFSRARKL